jgi:hypothetical protein
MPAGESEPFYMPDPNLFGHSDAYHLFTGYASELEEAGLTDRFPPDADLRKIVIELLAERYPVEVVRDDLDLIEETVHEARTIQEAHSEPE